MENEIVTKETAQNLMRIKGGVRGEVFITDREFVLSERGEEGLKRVEEGLEKLGYPIKYREIDAMTFYPIGLRALSLLAIKKVFNWGDKKIEMMGANAPKISLIIKLFMQFFLSMQQAVNQASKMWGKHYTVGNLVPVELNEEEKFVIVRLEKLNLHPIFCSFLGGYLAKIVEMVTKTPATWKEEKCAFRGDEFHEYLIKW